MRLFRCLLPVNTTSYFDRAQLVSTVPLVSPFIHLARRHGFGHPFPWCALLFSFLYLLCRSIYTISSIKLRIKIYSCTTILLQSLVVCRLTYYTANHLTCKNFVELQTVTEPKVHAPGPISLIYQDFREGSWRPIECQYCVIWLLDARTHANT